MKTVLKAFIVWFMLLAVPVQGFASVTMLLCEPLSLASSHNSSHDHAGTQHDHQAMMAAAGMDHDDGGSATGHHAGGKCSSCASCYLGAAMTPSYPTPLPVQAPYSGVIPFASSQIPSVDLALPERPPQSSFA
jgi:hypothetical protein